MKQRYVKMINGREQFEQRYAQIDIVNAPLSFSVPSRRIRERLMEEIAAARSIADLGCGHGGTLLLFAILNRQAKITGIDYSSVAIEKAARIAATEPRIETKVADLTRMALPAGFDVVYSSQVIEHIEEREAFVRNIHASLAPGGMLLLATVYKKRWARYIYRNAKGENVLDPTHVHECMDLWELPALLEKAGFEVTDYDLNLFRFPLIDIPLKLLTRMFKTRWMWRIANSSLVMLLRRWTGLPIFGFYNLQIIAKKR
jgi:2-polyprenyl-3-methyl-5-hydroxy-6-metoxy-1,4-benzoquinol methylase